MAGKRWCRMLICKLNISTASVYTYSISSVTLVHTEETSITLHATYAKQIPASVWWLDIQAVMSLRTPYKIPGASKNTEQWITDILYMFYLRTWCMNMFSYFITCRRLQCRNQPGRKVNFTNPRKHLYHIPQCSIQNRNVHISVLNGALWDMEQVPSGICELGQLNAHGIRVLFWCFTNKILVTTL